MRYEIADSDLVQRLLVSETYALQEKMDGQRLTVTIDEQGTRGFNKRGEVVAVPPWLYEELTALPQEPWAFDGELLDGSYHIFDLLDSPKASITEKPFDARINLLEVLVTTWGTERISVVHAHIEPKDKLKAFMTFGKRGSEGVVFRPHQANAHYKGQVYKYKFVNTVDAVVMGHTDGKASIEVGVYQDNELRAICNLAYDGAIEVGAVVEVRYRKLSNGGRLIEPVFIRQRYDKFPYSCTWSQLTEGKQEQSTILLDRQAREVAAKLGLNSEALTTITSNL